MRKATKTGRLPTIVLNEEDHERLTGLATAFLSRNPDVAEELLTELERAKVVPAKRLPATAVRMGSTITYKANGAERTVSLVYPGDADIAAGRISIMTPIGAALIGLSEGQSITWTARDGRPNELEVLSVKNVEEAEG
ncbi:nucleoside diphosphate kinase regulator [Xanthobacter sp. TB0136]|uniref:nucleoside diphosphate kinase regulator n=1 Tax=Xanthobacter sp. TB0136 TaxID=3459177 RepID=UPI00403A0CA9